MMGGRVEFPTWEIEKFCCPPLKASLVRTVVVVKYSREKGSVRKGFPFQVMLNSLDWLIGSFSTSAKCMYTWNWVLILSCGGFHQISKVVIYFGTAAELMTMDGGLMFIHCKRGGYLCPRTVIIGRPEAIINVIFIPEYTISSEFNQSEHFKLSEFITKEKTDLYVTLVIVPASYRPKSAKDPIWVG